MGLHNEDGATVLPQTHQKTPRHQGNSEKTFQKASYASACEGPQTSCYSTSQRGRYAGKEAAGRATPLTSDSTLESEGSRRSAQPVSGACGAFIQPTSVHTMERLRRAERDAMLAAAVRMPSSMTPRGASCQVKGGVGGLPLPM